MEQKQLKQFTFYDLYWDLIKQSDDASAGRLVRNICQYMFTNDEVIFDIAYTPYRLKKNATADERAKHEKERAFYDMSGGTISTST